MSFNPEQLDELRAPLSAAHVKEREQSGRKLYYIEGWHAEAEANRIFGEHAWDSTIIDLKCVSERPRRIGRGQYEKEGWGVTYTCTVRVQVTTPDGHLIIRDGAGAGHGIDADVGLAHESALKEAATDAEKRALKTFGNPFGLALYDKTKANVAVVESGHKPDLGPSTEGPDFWSCHEHGLSAYAAKKEGLDKVHDDLRHAASEIPNRAAIRQFVENNLGTIRRMPRSWRVELRQAVQARADELGDDGNERRAA